MQRYAAQEQFKKATQSPKSMPDVVIQNKLKTAARQEQEQSRQETEKQWGEPVKYGTTIVQVTNKPDNVSMLSSQFFHSFIILLFLKSNVASSC